MTLALTEEHLALAESRRVVKHYAREPNLMKVVLQPGAAS